MADPRLYGHAATLLSLGVPYLDVEFSLNEITSLGWLSNMGPEGAMTLLSTIAGSMITIAGGVFPITIVALALASSQFGPRLLGNFMRDRGNQIVLGTFIVSLSNFFAGPSGHRSRTGELRITGGRENKVNMRRTFLSSIFRITDRDGI